MRIFFYLTAKNEPLIPCTTNLLQEEYNACVAKVFRKLPPYLANGFAPVHLPALDPLFVPSISVNDSFTGFNVNGHVSNVYVRGLKYFKIKKMHLDPKKLTLYTQIHIPKNDITGQYEINGKVLMFPLIGQGNFTGYFG